MAERATPEKLQAVVEDLKRTIPPGKEILGKELDNFTAVCSRYIRQCNDGWKGVDWDKVTPIPDSLLRRHDELSVPSFDRARDLLRRLVVLKLNGGLGTTMGCDYPKNGIVIREGKDFYDCFVDQLKDLNAKYDVDVPLVLMNSPSTEKFTAEVLKRYTNSGVRIFIIRQQAFPRIDEQTLLPVATEADPEKNPSEWYPPGHADVYDTLLQSDVYDTLRSEGRELLFMSNGDNLGGTVDLRILNMMISDSYQYCCEVVEKTLKDVKGGTIIEYEGRLKLLETAEVPPEHMHDFTSIDKFKTFHTNNLWVRMDAIKPQMELDIIVNRKVVNGRRVIQLEQAMGAALSQFERTCAVLIPRTRFASVKACQDLLLIMSDLYVLENGYLLWHPSREGRGLPIVRLGPTYNKVQDFLARFAKGVPHLLDADTFIVDGDVSFGRDVSVQGSVHLVGPAGKQVAVPDGTSFSNGTFTFDDNGAFTKADFTE